MSGWAPEREIIENTAVWGMTRAWMNVLAEGRNGFWNQHGEGNVSAS